MCETNDNNIRLEYVILCFKNKEYEASKKYFESIIESYQISDTEYELGRLELILNNVEKAKLHFLRVVECKNDAFALYELGKIEIKQRNYLKTEEYLTRGLQLKENDLFSKFELARVKNAPDKYDEAEVLINELIITRKHRNLPVDSYLYLELAKCYLGKKQNKNARKILEKLNKKILMIFT